MNQEDYDKIMEALETLYAGSMLQRLVALIPEPEYEPKVGDLFLDSDDELWLYVEDSLDDHPFEGLGRHITDAEYFEKNRQEHGLRRVIP